MGNTLGKYNSHAELDAAQLEGDEESLFNVLAFCDRKTRTAAVFVSKRFASLFTTAASFKWRLERLHIEHGVYFPTTLPKEGTWKSLFVENDKKRHLWEVEKAEDTNSQTTSISVYARFKPPVHDGKGARRGRKAVLPLHQRLALIRIDKSLDSNKEALRVLKDQGAWFKDYQWDEIETPECGNEAAQEDDKPWDLLTSGIKLIDAENNRVVVLDSSKGLREFEFDGVMTDTVSQKEVYNASTHSLVCDVINGVNATCLVYGQTNSGKTFTMFGDQKEQDFSSSFAGIVPRACSELMAALGYRKKALNLQIDCEVCVSNKTSTSLVLQQF